MCATGVGSSRSETRERRSKGDASVAIAASEPSSWIWSCGRTIKISTVFQSRWMSKTVTDARVRERMIALVTETMLNPLRI